MDRPLAGGSRSNKDRNVRDMSVASGKQQSGIGSFIDMIRTVFIAVLIALLFRWFAFEPFNIPSGSMIPTLLVGDYLFVSKFSYGYSKYSAPLGFLDAEGRLFGDLPERGDVVVFKTPEDNSTDFIKRVIGLPGDHIQMRGGRLYINGERVERERIEDYPYQEGSRTRFVPQYIETLPNGRRHTIIELGGDTAPYADDTHEYTVPEGHLFMMGDNRDNSNDSRFSVGYVPVANVLGRAERLFFSLDGASFLEFWKWPFAIRFSRLGDKII